MIKKSSKRPVRGPDAVFALMDRELWLATTSVGPYRGGLVCTFVSKASIVPQLPRVTLGLAKQHSTCGMILESMRFALHLLWPHQLELVWRFGLSSSRDTDKFAGISTQTSPLGNPLVPETLAWLDCLVEASFDLGDRILFLAEAQDGLRQADASPLTVNQLYARASEQELRRLESLYVHDGDVDALAILAWRRAQDNLHG
jgi:flavin reductase (DIM6/NTAB) family NADH-FMN oxidoreductase RutF